MEDNKIIAEFMGALGTPNEMKYHNSWDWLMPVAQKCRLDSRCEYDDDDFWNNIHWALEECNLDSTYKAVVEFIKEYKTHTT
tara:strand:- start:219 stop:464 length:246 start_codon:yes stop_codon:yes gene_type:complete